MSTRSSRTTPSNWRAALAAANGVAERITFHQTLSSALSLPTPADVIISDLRGVLPLLQQHIPAIADARQRLLAPGGVLIPRRDTLWAALVDDAKLYRPYAEPWSTNAYDLDMAAGQPLVVNTWRKTNAKAEQLLVPPQAVGRTGLPVDHRARCRGRSQLDRGARRHGPRAAALV